MKLPLSNNAVGIWIQETSEDIKRDVYEKVQTDQKFSFKLNETTDVARKPRFISFAIFVFEAQNFDNWRQQEQEQQPVTTATG
jgi:hypothetical protein